MKFQLNIEIDEHQAKMQQMEMVNLVLDSIANTLAGLGAYYDVGVAIDSIVSGMTN